MSKARRNKANDKRPGGPDERIDRIEWLTGTGQHDRADREIKQLCVELDETDSVLKRNVVVDRLVKENMVGRNKPAPRAPLPGADESSALSEEEWARVDVEAKRLTYAMLEVGGDPGRVGNKAIDELGEDCGVPPGTSKDRKRLVRKVRDHVDRWVERHAA